jgi:uncharacterized protein DUF4432
MKQLSRRDLEARIGSVRDAFHPRTLEWSNGPLRGCRCVELTDAMGLEATVLADRCGDLGSFRWRGSELGFLGPAGRAPGTHMQTSFSGLLFTCGLRNVGPASEGEPMHGRIHASPADSLSTKFDWDANNPMAEVMTQHREAALFGPRLELSRTWQLVMGSGRLSLRDIVRNVGSEPEVLMLLYHFNIGFPMLDAGTRLEIDAELSPRDYRAAEGLNNALRMGPPEPSFVEQVYFLEGSSRASVINDGLDIRLDIEWDRELLRYATVWKSLRSGDYALGIEPGTCHPMGRATAREVGQGIDLPPGSEYTVSLSLGVASHVGTGD